MAVSGVEPLTRRFSVCCSNRLSYAAKMDHKGIEPLTSCVQDRYSPN